MYEFSEYDTVCRTPGCPNFGIRIRVFGDKNEPTIYCGPCDTRITDFQPAPEVNVVGTLLQDGTTAGVNDV